MGPLIVPSVRERGLRTVAQGEIPMPSRPRDFRGLPLVLREPQPFRPNNPVVRPVIINTFTLRADQQDCLNGLVLEDHSGVLKSNFGHGQ